MTPDTRFRTRPPGPAPSGSAPSVTDVAHEVLNVVTCDPSLSAGERKVVASYRRAIGTPAPVSMPFAEPRGATLSAGLAEPPRKLDLATLPVEVRLHVLDMMFRTAYAGGRCSKDDLAVLQRIAGAMGITGEQFDAARSKLEKELGRRRRRRFVAGTVVCAALIVLAVATVRAIIESNKPEDEATMFARIDEAIVERARRDAEGIAATSARLEQLERRIADVIEQRERAPAAPSAASSDDAELRSELQALKGSLERLQSQPDVFKRLENRYHRSVVLIMVAYDLVTGDKRQTRTAYGTGFFVTPTGMILTNKHVIEPWKFEVESARLRDAGYRLDERSVRIAAWPSGARVWKTPGKAIFGNAFNNLQRTLRVVATPPDDIEEATIRQIDGRTYTGRLHAQNNADLALLQAEVDSPVVALPLAPDASGVEKLDPVMVLGFPSGPAMLENNTAETSPSIGTVRKVEDTVQVTAPIVQGNSGGPVIDMNGQVIGIATRTAFGEASLGACIQSRHALALLPTAGEFLRDAESLIADGHPDAARSLLDLAATRGPDGDGAARIERLRGQLRVAR